MAINTPTTASSDVFGLRARSVLRAEIEELRQQVIMLRYEMERMKRREQERERIARIQQHTNYFHVKDLSEALHAPFAGEQMKPDDISQEPTQELAGEENDTTSLYPSVPSSAPRVTSHRLGQHPARSLEQALREHFSLCRRPCNVIYTNSIGQLSLFLDDVEQVPGVTFRCRPSLADDEVLCASYEEGDSLEMVSGTPFHIG